MTAKRAGGEARPPNFFEGPGYPERGDGTGGDENTADHRAGLTLERAVSLIEGPPDRYAAVAHERTLRTEYRLSRVMHDAVHPPTWQRLVQVAALA